MAIGIDSFGLTPGLSGGLSTLFTRSFSKTSTAGLRARSGDTSSPFWAAIASTPAIGKPRPCWSELKTSESSEAFDTCEADLLPAIVASEPRFDLPLRLGECEGEDAAFTTPRDPSSPVSASLILWDAFSSWAAVRSPREVDVDASTVDEGDCDCLDRVSDLKT